MSIYRTPPPKDPSLKAVPIREIRVSFTTPGLTWTRSVTIDLAFTISVDTIINSTRFRVKAVPHMVTGAWTVDECGELAIQPTHLLADPNKDLVGFTGTLVTLHLDDLVPIGPDGLRAILERHFLDRAKNLRLGVQTLNTRAQTHFDAAIMLAGLDSNFAPFGG